MNAKRLLALLAFTLTFVPSAAQGTTVGACSGYTPAIGSSMQAKVSPGASNRIRAAPGLNAARIGEMPPGSLFSTLYGPVCADELTWWLIRFQTTTGWTAEGKDATHWLEPALGQNHAPKHPPEVLGGTSTSVLYSVGICASVIDQAAMDSLAAGNEDPAAHNAVVVLGEDTLKNEPGICAPLEMDGDIAVGSPFGLELAADIEYLDGIGLLRATLPDIAYTMPGLWSLRVGGYTLSIDIQAPAAPFMQGLYANGSSYTLILGGFQPNERIAVVTSRTTADAVGYMPSPDEAVMDFDASTGITEFRVDPSIFVTIQDMAVIEVGGLTRPEFTIQPRISDALAGTLTALPEADVLQVSRFVFDQIDENDFAVLDQLGMNADSGSTGVFGLTFQDFGGTEVQADANGFVYADVALDGSPLAAVGQSGALAVWPNLANLYVPGSADEETLRQTLFEAYWADAESTGPVSCTYTVASGDTLNRIAQRYNVTIEQLLAANPQVTNPDVIFRGLILTLPNCSP